MKKYLYKNLNELKIELSHIFTLSDKSLQLHKPELIKDEAIDKITYTAVFAEDETLKAKCRRIIRLLADARGVKSRSLRPLYSAYAGNKMPQSTIPAINIRAMTYDTARSIFRTAAKTDTSAFIIEIAKSESDYTHQSPDEFAAVVLAAAIKEDYTSPIFLQGDHCQFSRFRYDQDKQKEIKRLRDWVKQLIEAGFYNIDIDGSTLVDLTKESLQAQQKDNASVTALITKYIREIQPAHTDIAIGGEIGHIGEKNSTNEEFEAFMHLYLNLIPKGEGISKVSVQTGTSHGGTISPEGTIKKMDVDFGVLEKIGANARDKYKLAGAVQHGASTLPLSMFHKFVQAGTAEVHLSTAFQNITYDQMPQDMKDKMYKWLRSELKSEWKQEWSEQQFIYKTRKKAWGPFKKQLWGLTENEKKPIIKAVEDYVESIFVKLNVADTKEDVIKYVGR